MRGTAEASDLPILHAEGFYDAVAGDGLNVGEFILTAAGGVAHLTPDLLGGINDDRQEQHQNPRQFAAQRDHRHRSKHKGEELLQELRHDAGHGKLHAFDIVHDGRDQSTGGVLLEKGGRAPQYGLIEIVPQIGDHAKAGMVHEVGSRVIEDTLQN